MVGIIEGARVDIRVGLQPSGQHKQIVTRVAVGLPAGTPEGLEVVHQDFPSGINRLLDLHDIKIGISKVDDAFIIRGANEAETRDYMRQPRVQRAVIGLIDSSGKGSIVAGKICTVGWGMVTSSVKLNEMLEHVLTAHAALSAQLAELRAPEPAPLPTPQATVTRLEPIGVQGVLQTLSDRSTSLSERARLQASIQGQPITLSLRIERIHSTLSLNIPERHQNGQTAVGSEDGIEYAVRFPPAHNTTLSEIKPGSVLQLTGIIVEWESLYRHAVVDAD